MFQNHFFDFFSFFEVIKLMRRYPPNSCFHQQLGIVIFVGKESVERKANSAALIGNFSITNINNFGSQGISHNLCYHGRYAECQ
jgi:hypothetical protein